MPRAAAISLVIVLITSVLRAAPIDDLPAPIATRQSVFSIPFTVPAVGAAQPPAEVRLLASGDRGTTWQIVDRVDLRAQLLPYKGGFTFRAARDEEYWFAIRTVDRTGQMRAEQSIMPELRVVVDTRPPRLDFSAMRGSAGEIVVRWDTVDPNLKPDSLKLQYQSSANPRWQPIAIDPPSDGARSASSNTATWWPADAAGLLTIKAEVSDAAGNTTVAQAQVDLAQHSSATAYQPRANSAPPTASMNRSVMSGESTTTALDAGFSRGEQWPPDVRTELPLGRGASERRSPASESIRSRDEPNLDVGPIEGPALVPPVDGATHPPIGNQYIRQPNMPREAMPQENALPRETVRPHSFDYVLPPGEQLRMVNSTAFELDYEVESVGRSGIAKVELWMTLDGGRTWQNLGADADSRSPFRATVDGEGVYGFRLTVQSGSGLGGRPPQPGELPEVWIGVDLTRPMARLVSAEASTGERVGEVVIRYEARDALLASRPITLLQSGQPGGPWTTIAAGLSNSGQFSWRFDETTPERVYLRLEVRDEAGNVATVDAFEPMILQRVLPQGRLRDVRPVGVSARYGSRQSR